MILDLYSFTLAASILAVGAAVAASTLALLKERRDARREGTGPLVSRGWWRLARKAAVVGLALVLLSILVHVGVGHRPGTQQALPPLAFVAGHRAFVVVPLFAVGALWLAARGLARTPEPPASGGPGA